MNEQVSLQQTGRNSNYYYLRVGERWLYTVEVYTLIGDTKQVDWSVPPFDRLVLAKDSDVAKSIIRKLGFRQRVSLGAYKTRIRG